MKYSAIHWLLRLLPFLLMAAYSLSSLAQDYPSDTPVPASPAPIASNNANENRNTSVCPIKYPPFAREHGVQGDLIAEYTFDEEGNRRNIRVISRKLNKTSVRNRSGDLVDVTSVFDDTVIRALSDCRQPVSKYSCPKSVTTQAPFSFKLTG